jgi:excisionase family DNA binding protein
MNRFTVTKTTHTLIALDTELADNLLSALKETRLELAKIREQAKGNEPLTMKQAAAYLHVSAPTLSEYIKRKEITPSEYGSRVWVTRKELDAFIDRHRRQ